MIAKTKPTTQMRRLLLPASGRAALSFLCKTHKADMTAGLRQALAWTAETLPPAGWHRRDVLSITAKGKRYGRDEYDLQQMLWRTTAADREAISIIKDHYDLDTEQAAVRLAVRLAAIDANFTPKYGIW